MLDAYYTEALKIALVQREALATYDVVAVAAVHLWSSISRRLWSNPIRLKAKEKETGGAGPPACPTHFMHVTILTSQAFPRRHNNHFAAKRMGCTHIAVAQVMAQEERSQTIGLSAPYHSTLRARQLITAMEQHFMHVTILTRHFMERFQNAPPMECSQCNPHPWT